MEGGATADSTEHKEEIFFSFVLFAVKENCTEAQRHGEEKKAFPLCDSVAKAFMTEGDEPSS